MAEDLAASGGANGLLYMLDAQGTAHSRLSGIHISNSICWSADGRRMYFADTPKRRIRSFACGPDGTLTDEQTFATVAVGSAPDGSDADRDGRVWNAEWGGSRVTVYDPDGAFALQFSIPVLQPTCIAFGGPELDHVFVTSATDELTAEALASQPLAGDTLLYRIAPVGKQANLYHHRAA
jgi:L-arabinonolactonase